jgi:glycosyltransferase involved in cell wall biosynthesis
MRKPLVAVLMATYNGEKYISEQLESILCQRKVNVHLYISDDGSTDKTISILKVFFKKYSNQFKKLYSTNYKNPARNFLSIIKKISTRYTYYAFSDQDDIWLDDKLIHSIKKIEQGADLYLGRTEIIDKNKNHLGYSTLFIHKPCFENAIVQSIAGSNTFLFNKKIFNLLLKSSNLNISPPMHDWWTYILATFCRKKVFYDSISKVRYRQHKDNVNGFNLGFKNILKRINYALKGRYKKWNDMNVRNLSYFIEEGNKENIKIFQGFKSLKKNYNFFNFIKSKNLGIFRARCLNNLFLAFGFMLGKV